MSDLLFEEKTFQLRGAVFEVFKGLGAGWDEETYHQALIEVFRATCIPFQTKARQVIFHRGVEVDRFECDLIAWDLIVLELKVLPLTTFAPVHYAQLTHYLKAWNKRLGLLVNFGGTKASVARVLWKKPEWQLVEDFSAFENYPPTEYQFIRDFLKSFALFIGEHFGLGFPELTYRSLLGVEANAQSIACQHNLTLPAIWNDKLLAEHKTDHFLLDNTCVVNIRANLEYPPRYDFARMKTYLRTCGVKFGFILNFGRKQIQIFGVNPE
ncbi:MAG: GxxExxY protein [Anaerolineales bacterium]|nr:GxxExxY protein [Anaerolineales bacterium]